MSLPPFAAVDGDGLRLLVRVTPRARRSEIAGTIDAGGGRSALAVRLAAPPVEGAANRALVRFLADRLGVPPSRIVLVAGEKSRLKTVRIAAAAPGLLAALAP